MKPKRILIFFFLLALASALGACSSGTGIATSWPGLAVDEETAYLAFNTQVFAIQLANGAERWRFPKEPNNRITFFADPTFTPDGQLLAAGYNNVLYSLDPQTGELNWEFDQVGKRFVASPLAVEQGIFAPNADKTLYALDLSGNLRWTFATPGESWAQPLANGGCECIYLTSMDHRVYALRIEDGSQIWQSEDLGGAIVGAPALSEEGLLFVGTFGSEVLALEAQTGRVAWRFQTEGWVWSGPALAGDRLYVGDLEGNFYALQAATGQLVWRLAPEQLDGPISGSPLVLDDTIYFTSESGSLYALDPAGTIRWTIPIGGKLYAAPVSASDLILVAPIQADILLAAVGKDGSRKWSFTPEK